MSGCEAPNYGDFVVVQRQSFMKLHKLSPSGSVKLGKSLVLTDKIVGKPFWTTYRMEPKKDKKGVFNLVECSLDDDRCEALMKDVSSGIDNRNIVDDGSSQKLSSDEIIGMRDEGLSSREIVGTLIENSATFQEKTEYSQEKYLKKKEKKYFEYITIRKPTVRLIADIMYKQDPLNIMGLRCDTLSQLATAVNLHPHGKYIMYESGCQSLASAAILNGLSSEGRLILTYPGSNPQKQAILGMNLSKEQQERLIYVNIYTLLRRLLHNKSNIVEKLEMEVMEAETDLKPVTTGKDTPEENMNGFKSMKDDSAGNEEPVAPMNEEASTTEEPSTNKEPNEEHSTNKEQNQEPSTNEKPNEEPTTNEEPNESGIKRKHSGDEECLDNKKPRYEVEADKAVSLLKESKADGLIIVCKEHPANILKAFLPFVGPSKNFVVFGAMREPLQELSLEIRKRPEVIYMQLSEMWLRNYQVMENRTHPFVSMSGGGGYLLTGIVVK